MRKSLLSLSVLLGFGALEVQAQYDIDKFAQAQGSNVYTIIGDASDLVSNAVDLDFHPTRKDELWVLNTGTTNSGGTSVIFFDAGMPSQTSQFVVDGNAWHFLASGSSMAFGENGNWGTAQGRLDANHNGSTFTGPTLWSSDLSIYGVLGNPPTSQMNGSHLDMVHQSPWGMGIAHEVDNVYWVFDGYNGNVVRYDFVQDHGPGQDDHSDALVRRYSEVQVSREGSLPSHMVLDKSSGWLYLCDVGNDRILRMDINTGTVKGSLPSANGEPITEHSEMENVVWEEYITGLDNPVGIDVAHDRLIFTEYGTGTIHLYDISDAANPTQVGVLQPGSDYVTRITGIKIGPKGNIWFTDRVKRHVVQISNAEAGTVSTQEISLDEAKVKIFPNPTEGMVNISVEGVSANNGFDLVVSDLLGKTVHTARLNSPMSTADLTGLNSGIYLVQINQNGERVASQKIVLE